MVLREHFFVRTPPVFTEALRNIFKFLVNGFACNGKIDL